MEKVYKYEWRGVRTGWDYKVIFKKASTVQLGEYEEISLPRGSFSLKKTNWEYDTYPIGITSAKTLEGSVNMGLVSSSKYDDFAKMLYDPVLKITRTANLVEYSYYTGTVVEFYIKFNKNSDIETNEHRLIMIGIIKEDEEIEQEGVSSVYNFVAVDINRVILEQLGFKGARGINHIDDVERAGYIEAYDTINNRAVVQVAGKGFSILFQKYVALELYVSTVATQMYRDIRRDSSLNYEISLPLPSMSKQTFDGSGVKGGVLSKNDIYVLSHVYYGVSPVGGCFYEGDSDGIIENYGCVWDYLADTLESQFKKGFFNAYGMYSVPAFSYISDARIVELDAKKIGITLRQRAKVLKSSSSSCYEVKGEKYKDIDSVKEVSEGSRNGTEYNLPIYFNCMPSQSEFKFISTYLSLMSEGNVHDYLTGLGLNVSWNAWVGNSKRISGLYYKDNTAFTDNPNGEMFRVHEHCKNSIKPGYDSADLIAYEPVVYSQEIYKNPNVYVADLQKNGEVGVLPAVLMKIFGNREQYTAKIVLPIDYKVELLAGGSVGYWVDNPESTVKLSLLDIDPRRTETRDEWFIIGSTIDYEKEIVELEIMLRMI